MAVAVALLQRLSQGLVAKIRQCACELGIAEAVHCLIWSVFVNANEGSEVMVSR